MRPGPDDPTIPQADPSGPPPSVPVEVAEDGTLRVPASYRLEGLLGRGGMGSVYLAVDEQLARGVAVKLLHDGLDPSAEAKFEREARVTARLAHPGIVPVHQLGLSDAGRPFFVMRRVAGRDLSERLRELESIGAAERLELLQIFLKVCDAVSYAHSQGVVHRDLKPANVMVGAYGEVLVVDWGLARLTGEPAAEAGLELAPPVDGDDHLRTLDGAVMGTPAYMPPEQAEGRIGDIDERSDVYALGAMLYQMLTLRPPYRAGNALATLEKVIEGDLEPPSEVVDWEVPWELEAVVLRAMAPVRARRYRTVEALGRDVNLFLEGRAVGAARYSSGQQALRWLRQNRVLVGAASLLLVGLTLAALVSYRNIAAALGKEQLARQRADAAASEAKQATTKAQQATEQEAAQRREADAQRQRAQAEHARAERRGGELAAQLRRALTLAASAASSERRTIDVASYLRAARDVGGAERSAELQALALALPDPVLWPLERTGGELIRVLADGRALLWRRGAVYARDPAGREQRLHAPIERRPTAASADGRMLAIDIPGRLLMLRDPSGGRQLLARRREVISARFVGDTLVAAMRGGQVCCWGFDGRERWSLNTGHQTLSAMAVDGESLTLAAPRANQRALLLRYRLPGLTAAPPLQLPLRIVTSLERWQGRVLAGSKRGLIAVVGRGGEVEQLLDGHSGGISRLVGWQQGLISASHDGTLRCWDVATGRCVQTLADHGAGVVDAWLDGERRELVSGQRGAIIRWALASESSVYPVVIHGSGQSGTGDQLAVAGDLLATSACDGCVQLWDARSGRAGAWWPAHRLALRQLLVGPEGAWLATAGSDGYVKLWSREGRLRWIAVLADDCSGLALSPDGSWLAVSSKDGWLASFAVSDGRLLARRYVAPGACGAAFAGELLLTGAGAFRGSELEPAGKALPAPSVREGARRDRFSFAGLRVTPDGATVAVNRGAEIELYGWPQVELLSVIRHAHPVTSMRWVSDQVLAVSCAGQGSLRLHDRRGRALGGALQLSSTPMGLASDGGRLFVGQSFGRIARIGQRSDWIERAPRLRAGQPARLAQGARQQAPPLRASWRGSSPLDLARYSHARAFASFNDPRAADLLAKIERPSADVLAYAALTRAELLLARKQQDVAGALRETAQALAQRSADPTILLRARLLRADLLLVSGKLDEATQLLSALPSWAPAEVVRRSTLLRAMVAHARGQRELGQRLLLGALESRRPGQGSLGYARSRTALSARLAEFLERQLPEHPLALLEAAQIWDGFGVSDRIAALMQRIERLIAKGPQARWEPLVKRLLAEQ